MTRLIFDIYIRASLNKIFLRDGRGREVVSRSGTLLRIKPRSLNNVAERGVV